MSVGITYEYFYFQKKTSIKLSLEYFFSILTFSLENICRYTSHIFLAPPVYDTMLCVVHVCSKFCAVLVSYRQTDRDVMIEHNEQVGKQLEYKICDFDF